MKKDLVEAILIVDRSGSMNSILESTISGINEFLNAQRMSDKTVKVTFTQFDMVYESIFNGVDAKLVADITTDTYIPRGGTALYDAIGKTISEVGARLANTPESERPEKILVAIITDGEENSSREFTADRVKSMIEHQNSNYSWEFVYIGANQDAMFNGTQLGIAAANTFGFAATSNANTRMYKSLASLSTAYYSTGKIEFTDEDREAQEQELTTNNTLPNTPTWVSTGV